jgi:hypothetical protein
MPSAALAALIWHHSAWLPGILVAIMSDYNSLSTAPGGHKSHKNLCPVNSASSRPCPASPRLPHAMIKLGKALRSVSSSAAGLQKPGRR